MVDAVKRDVRERMKKSIEVLRLDLVKLRTGRANASLLDQVSVNYYGSAMPINQVANVNVSDARTITVQPWEKKMVPEVEKAIRNSDLGLNPITSGDVIRVPLPPLTEQRRKEMIRVVRHEGEQTKVAIRNVRRDGIQHLKALIKDANLGKDEQKRGEDEIQKITDQFVAEVDGVLKEKEDELLEF